MTTTDIIIRSNETIAENTNLEELTKGCTSAIVTFSLEDRGLIVNAHKRYKTHKMVVFFDEGFCRETVHAHLVKLMIAHSRSLSKSYIYRFRLDNWIKSKYNFFTYLLRNVTGLVVDNDVIDYRK